MKNLRFLFLLIFLPGIAHAWVSQLNPDTPQKVQRDFNDVQDDLNSRIKKSSSSWCIDNPTLCVDTKNNIVNINTSGSSSLTGNTTLHISSSVSAGIAPVLRLVNPNSTSGTGAGIELTERSQEDYRWRIASVATAGSPSTLDPKLVFSMDDAAGSYSERLTISPNASAGTAAGLYLDNPTSGGGTAIRFRDNGTTECYFGIDEAINGGSSKYAAIAALTGLGINLYTNNSSSAGFTLFSSNETYLANDGTHFIDADPTNTRVIPRPDNTWSSGNSSFRWTAVWAVNGTIQTSASKEKREIRELSDTGPIAISTPTASVNTVATSTLPDLPRGIVFKWKSTKGKANDQDIIGFLGDDLPMEAHAIKDDGTRDPDSFYTSAVIGILCAHVKELEKEVAVLKAKNP